MAIEHRRSNPLCGVPVSRSLLRGVIDRSSGILLAGFVCKEMDLGSGPSRGGKYRLPSLAGVGEDRLSEVDTLQFNGC